MRYKAVVFDLDGVLVYTDKYHYLAWKQIACEKGIEFDEKDNDRLRGVSRMKSLEIVLEKYQGVPINADEKEKLAEKKNQIYRSFLAEMTPEDVSDDVKETLQELKEKGYLLAVGSSSKNAVIILEKTGLMNRFDRVVDGTLIKHSKPDPEVFLKAAELLGVQPEECLVVEDAEAGIQAAKSAGMDSAAIGKIIQDVRTEYKLKKISDLLSVL